MRYSRFKKQIEGTTSVPRKPRNSNPNSPKKARVSKASKDTAAAKKVKNERRGSHDDNDGEGRIKLESGDSQVTDAGSTSETPAEMGMGDLYSASPVAGPSPSDFTHNPNNRIKQEPGLRARSETAYMMPTPNTSTYASMSPSPSLSSQMHHSAATSFQNVGNMADMDLMTSFNHIPGDESLYEPLMAGHEFGVSGMGGGMSIGNPYDMWGGGHAGQVQMSGASHASRGGGMGPAVHDSQGSFKGEMEVGEGGVLVKTEPRWEDTYHQM